MVHLILSNYVYMVSFGAVFFDGVEHLYKTIRRKDYNHPSGCRGI